MKCHNWFLYALFIVCTLATLRRLWECMVFSLLFVFSWASSVYCTKWIQALIIFHSIVLLRRDKCKPISKQNRHSINSCIFYTKWDTLCATFPLNHCLQLICIARRCTLLYFAHFTTKHWNNWRLLQPNGATLSNN